MVFLNALCDLSGKKAFKKQGQSKVLQVSRKPNL